MTKSLLLVGVGGQGTILVSKILSEGLLEAGYDVKMSEIHGMSQRGGSVTTQIKFGEKVYTSSIAEGEADVLVAFEKVEAARYLPLLKKTGALVVNDEEIYPLPVLSGLEEYPFDVMEELKEKVGRIKVLKASEMAKELGEPRSQNIIMLGALIKALELEEIDWVELIKRFLPQRFHEVNIEAFNRGLNL
ncbi:MAG: indolepyruvate oxidoreductase subunit beta [Tissierellia bacterium]|nr:indolepyruvate oxidoreductase subunit beta [Tissierellia bacterium]